jgi:hypothetical protein
MRALFHSIFIGHPLPNQLLFFVSGVNIKKMSKQHDAERYVKKIDTRKYMIAMLFGVLEGYHSTRELVSRSVEQRTQIVSFGDELYGSSQYAVRRQRALQKCRIWGYLLGSLPSTC